MTHMLKESPGPDRDELSGGKDNLLIIFTRYPEPGKVKTRMIPVLGIYGAARLQRDMLCHTIKTSRRLLPDITLEIHGDGGVENSIHSLIRPDLSMKDQGEGDLGHRMHNAFSNASERGFKRIVLIGTDCPLITTEIIRQAFDRLDTHDCVMGPAMDGGYYLIGLKHPCQELFTDILWGSSRVFEHTLIRALSCGLSVKVGERLPDIDRPEDIAVWKAVYRKKNPRISIIIPTLNEEGSIAEILSYCKPYQGNIEILVVDAGSSDKTATIASSCGARVILSKSGRAMQMNRGAMDSTGEILLFLHADTRLPEDFDQHIIQALADPRTITGAFSPGFDDNSRAMKIIEWGATLRSRYLQLPYGDQGIFLRKADFMASGGFPELPIMEDVAFIQAIKKKGRITTSNRKIITSSRRYAVLGVLQTWVINQCVITSFLKGAEPAKLAYLYRSHKGIRDWLCFLRDVFLGRHNKQEGEHIREKQ